MVSIGERPVSDVEARAYPFGVPDRLELDATYAYLRW
jgi:hypothetical protein